jgi:hypothetical protein
MIREALNKLGYGATAKSIVPWIKRKFGQEVKPSSIAVTKSWMKKEHGWIVEADQALGVGATAAQLRDWLKNEKGKEFSEEYTSLLRAGIAPKWEQPSNPPTSSTTSTVDGQEAMANKSVEDALAVLKRVSAFAEEMGGVECLEELLQYLK